jgi:tetraacyldisaccharide 4'-kinase
MRAPGWLDARDETPARRLALLPLAGLAALYGGGARVHRALYRAGWLRAQELPCRVVSVGSLAAGGSGKTPLAAWLAAGLHAAGLRVALASRGYGRRAAGGVEVVSDGDTILCGPDRAGDEPLLLAAHAPGVPVVVARDRAEAGRLAVRRFGSDLLVLDDGFQHHRLRRDLDLVVLDGAVGLGNGWTLPRGPLREPVGALALADAVVVMDGPLPAADESRVAALAPRAERFETRRAPRSLRPLAGGVGEPPEALRGREVGMLCGIARPDSFRRTLAALGARVVEERVLPDHHPYQAADLAALGARTRLWVTTEKDAVKLQPDWAPGADLRVVELGVEGGAGLVDFVRRRLAQARPEAR